MTHARRTAVLVGLLLVGPLGAQERSGPFRIDDPGGRGKANLEWFGPVSADYLDFKTRAARAEVQRWSGSFSKVSLLSAAPAGPGPLLGAAASSWVNLGPFGDAQMGRDVDAGRPSAIVALPNNVLLLATSGGGVFRCGNADPNLAGDWAWQTVTDNLPASSATGNVAVGDLQLGADGTTLFLGLGDAFDATGRGIYRSSDLGSSWSESAVAGAATRIFCIRPLSAGAAGVILVGSNDGLKRSSNGGASFQNVAGALAVGEVWSIQSLSATEVVASLKNSTTGVGTLHYSSDAGATWTQATLTGSVTGLATGSNVIGRMTLATSAASASEVWGLVEVWNPGTGSPDNVAQGLLHSTNKGHSWNFVTPATPNTTGTLFKGTGNSMADDSGQGWYNHLIAVSPSDSGRLLVGTNLATYVTLDGGQNWVQATEWTGSGHPYSHADNHCSAWSPSGTTLFVGNDGGISVFKDPWRTPPPKSADTTYVDNARNRGLATHLVYHLGSTTAASPADARYRITLGCQDDGTRVRQVPSGGTLQTSGDFTDQVGGDGFGTLIHPADGNQMLAAVYRDEIYRSTDGGKNFSPSYSGITEAKSDTLAPFITRLAQGWADPTGNTVYTYSNGKVYKSVNFGASWSALGSTGLPPGGTNATSDPTGALYLRNVGAARSNGNVIGVAGNGGRVFLTRDGGGTWTQAGTLPNNGLSLSYLSFDGNDPQTFYVASVAPTATANHLWKSSDGGLTFTTLDGAATAGNGFPFGIPVHIVLPDPKTAGVLYAGTDFGVYQSGNGGGSWSRLGTGLPLVAARDLYLAPDGSFLRAGTYGRGVWELTLGASTGTATVAFASGGATQIVPGGKASYAATVTGAASNSNVAWSDGGAGGSFSPVTTASGASTSYTAPVTARTVTLTAASVEQPAVTATLAVQVYDPAALQVQVSPASLAMVGGDVAAAFQATVTGGAPAQTVTWTASAGSITSAGVFTAPAQALGSQTVTITATSPYAARPGTATVTVHSLDLDNDGAVGLDDLAYLAFAYGTVNPAAKLSAGTTVNDADLTAFLAHF
jgi:hypothetical protein